MGDSTEMTIEFLRARLLSERSISRTARQRADQLAKRVMELEEQLRAVTIQRKKAEKAAVEVLAILESQGADGFSEVIDSSSEHADEDCDEGKENGCAHDGKRDENSIVLMTKTSEEVDGLSGSEVEASAASNGQSLSWKSHSNSPNSRQKLRLKQFKQRQRRPSLLSNRESLPKYQLGKSCRRIKPKEMGSPADNESGKSVLDAEEQSVSTLSSNYVDDQPDENGETSRDEIVKGPPPHDENNRTIDGVSVNDHDEDEEMKRVLQQQEQLIDQFQAEENAQREWEEKYNENKSSMLSAYEVKNQLTAVQAGSNLGQNTNLPDLNSDFQKAEKLSDRQFSSSGRPIAQIPNLIMPNDQKPQGIIPENNDSNHRVLAPRHSDGFGPNETFTDGGLGKPSKQHDMLVGRDGTNMQEFAFPTEVSFDAITGKQDQALYFEKSDSSSHSNQNSNPDFRRFFESTSSWSQSSDHSAAKLTPWGSSEMQRRLPQTALNNLGGVLNALQIAKTSLKQQLNASPSPNGGTLAITAPSYPRVQAETLDIPNGAAALFRLPTDSFPQDNLPRQKFYDSQLRLPSSYADIKHAPSANGYPSRSSSYIETEPRVSVGTQLYDPYLTSSTIYSNSSQYSLPYSDSSREGLPFQNGVSRPYLETRNQMSRRDPYAYHAQTAQFDLKRL
ncbi:hypothetical protein IHE45_05G003500 [Dioscorea alata]|uniref:Uncharacterized protein n=2 Tax=Dioscorea alata TaxID=55571 RepID=A0ACB7VZA4_DIOAL|nr:hypothetical protein IHE45_05G003500 [Dioscorea alata]KAH7680603.1 hypothetical protein IHE45_05G003500 [Dioscorea alata]